MKSIVTVVTMMLAPFCFATLGVAAPIDAEIKETVAFVYVVGPDGKPVPNGTGFFVSVEKGDTNGTFAGNLVTAKHVLMTPDRTSWLPFVLLRLNKRDGTSEFGRIDLVTTGTNKTVFTHSDSSVDLAVIPALPDLNKFKYKFMPTSFIATTNDLQNFKIREGSDIFFTGLFSPYAGYERNYPVCRFGRVALMTEEKIEWDGKASELYLVEIGAYGGNSGSPVFFYLGPDREPGKMFAGAIVKLAGVMKGSYLDIQPVTVVDLNKVPLARSNMGIAAVIPGHQLLDILLGEELKKQRGF